MELGATLGTQDTAPSQTNKSPCPHEAYSLRREKTDDKIKHIEYLQKITDKEKNRAEKKIYEVQNG